MASDYVAGTGYPSDLYPGGQSDFWAGYGGFDPVILQFTDAAEAAGQTLDADAYRGNTAQLQQRARGSPVGVRAGASDPSR